MATPVFRAIAVERRLDVDRSELFDAAVDVLPETHEVISCEPPWRLVTSWIPRDTEQCEFTWALVEPPGGGTLYSVSVVAGPEREPGALDDHLPRLEPELRDRLDAVVDRLRIPPLDE